MTHQDITEALLLMQQIPLSQIEKALEIQEGVFQQFGDRISSAVKRVYRSALKKSLEWAQRQEFWQTSFGNRGKERTPAMLPARGKLKPRYSLDLAKQTPHLRQEIDQLCQYWSDERHRVLSKASIHRYLKDIYGMLGWLNAVKAIPLEDLSLTKLVPVAALYDSVSAHQTVEQVAEYLEWLISERNVKPATQRCVLEVVPHIAEFLYHVLRWTQSVGQF